MATIDDAMLLLFAATASSSASRATTASHASRAVIRSAAIRMDMQRRSQAAAEMGQLIATTSAADQRRAQEVANAFRADQAAGTDEADRDARDAYLAFLQQPNAATTTAATTSNEATPSEAKQLLQRIKDAGVAGAVSYAGWELAFWAASVPVCLVTYYQLSGHWPDFSDQVPLPSHSSSHSRSHSHNHSHHHTLSLSLALSLALALTQDDVTRLGAEAFAFVNVARFAVPLRIGLALSTVPWVQANIVDRFAGTRGDAAEPQAEPIVAAPMAPPAAAAVWPVEWPATGAAAAPEQWRLVAPTAATEWPVAEWPAAVPSVAAAAPAAAVGLSQPVSKEEAAKRAWLAKAWVPMTAAKGSR